VKLHINSVEVELRFIHNCVIIMVIQWMVHLVGGAAFIVADEYYILIPLDN
jgi:hypothetical protein